jgi:CheY-like chemotaxis protein
MGGRVDVRSVIDKGSTFAFNIITANFDVSMLVAQDEEIIDDIKEKCRGLKALLAEDIAINQEIAMALLGEYNIELTVANNGAEVVDKYTKGKYDLIFMDIQMPIMDGIQATKEIRKLEKEGEHIPIIAMTANAMQDDRIATKEAGMDEHVSKPFEIKELNIVLSKIVKMLRK